MSLKQLSDEDRILFLREFTLQLILNSTKDKELRKIIEIEKIKKRYLEDNREIEFPSFPISQKIKKTTQSVETSLTQSSQNFKSQFKSPYKPPISHKSYHPIQPLQSKLPQYPAQASPSSKSPQNQLPQTKTLSTTDNSLKKLDPLIKDPSVQMIECPGAGKNILVKARNRMNIARIILTEQEIKNIIDYFSSSAKIPVVGGIFKAAIDYLLISAVISEYAGSRFIITKKSPYGLIEGVVS